LSPENDAPAAAPEAARGYGIYLHTPFCATKCPYCDFYSGVFPESWIAPYVAAVKAEVARAASEPLVARLRAGGAAASLFVGGGTPSHLDPGALAELLAAIRAAFPLAPGAEVTVECNPESLDAERAAVLRDLGVDRVSLGVQSLDDRVLVRLGRPHDAAAAFSAARRARAAFPRVNYDLILAVPGLTRTSLARTLERLLALAPDHLSAYGLTLEPGTVFGALAARGDLRPAPDEEYLAQDELVAAAAARARLLRYEISNFARPGEECRHNLAIWRGGFYLGLGPSAHSYLPGGAHGVRRANGRDLAAYVAQLARGESPAGPAETVSTEQAMAEFLLLGLRLTAGIELATFGRRFGIDLAAATGGEMAALVDAGFLTLAGGRLAATARGRAVLDSILGRLATRLRAA
jgi:oxygen-independent coproporphyrinogen-3 oxidase